MQDYERVWIDHMKYLLKLAEDAIRDMDIADKEFSASVYTDD